MSDPRAGWYADVNVPGGERYWDGEKWTEHRRDGAGRVPPPPPPPAKKRVNPVVRVVGIVLAVIVAAALVSSLMQGLGSLGSSSDDSGGSDDTSDASTMDCDGLASEAVDISKDKDVELLKVRNPVIKVDNRDTYSTPTGDKEALILSCTGSGVWSTGANQKVLLRYTIDSDGDTFVAYAPQ